LESLKQDLDRDRKLYARLDGEHTSACREYEKLKEQLENIEKLGPDSVCDRCLRPLGNDYAKIKSHLSKELDESSHKVKDLEKKRDQVEIKGKSLKGEEKTLDELKNGLEKEIRTLLGEKKDLEDVDKRLEEKKKTAEVKCFDCDLPLGSMAFASKIPNCPKCGSSFIIGNDKHKI